jgi:hypothetical protein
MPAIMCVLINLYTQVYYVHAYSKPLHQLKVTSVIMISRGHNVFEKNNGYTIQSPGLKSTFNG